MNKETVVDKYRYINIEHNWWELTLEDFSHSLAEKGIYVSEEDIQFSGFNSQGDGASFTGFILWGELKKFMELHGLDEQYASVYYFAQRQELKIVINRTPSHYYHSNTMILEIDGYIDDDDESDDDDLRSAVYKKMYQEFEKIHEQFEEAVLKILKGYANDLYRQLDEEYHYLISDEAVLEAIEANGIDTNINEEKETEHGICSDQR